MLINWGDGEGEWMYPDSVNRVRPPHTTMPKTLAALPSNQYATIFSLVLGNADFFATLDPVTADSPSMETCCGACVV